MLLNLCTEKIPMMNNTTETTAPKATVPVRVFGAISYGFLSSLSVFMNILLISVLSHGHFQFRRLAFFTLAWQMVVCDLMTQSIQLFVAVPVTFAGQAVYGHPSWYYALLFFDTVAYNATLYFSGLLTLSRVCVFFLPGLNQLLFSPSKIGYTIFALWIWIFAFCACYPIIGCRKAFSETGFFMYHDCPQQLSQFGVIFRQFSFAMSTYLPILMLLAYLVCFIYIRYFFGPRRAGRQSSVGAINSDRREEERMERARRQREKNFLIQSFLICGFLEIQNLAFDFVPLLFSSLHGQWAFVATFAENWISILLNSISPIILFSFNHEVRKCLAELLPFRPLGIARVRPAVSQSLTIPPSQLLRPLPGQRKSSHPFGSISRSHHESDEAISQRHMSFLSRGHI